MLVIAVGFGHFGFTKTGRGVWTNFRSQLVKIFRFDQIGNFVKLFILSVIIDNSDYNRVLHYIKHSATSTKLLSRKEGHFRAKLRVYTIRDGKLFRDWKQLLHSEDALPTLILEHQDRKRPVRIQLEGFIRTKYHVERLRQFCRRVVTSCPECQQRVAVRKTGPMIHLNKQRVEWLCKQLGLTCNSTNPLS